MAPPLPLLRRIALGWCVLMAAALTIVQLTVAVPPPFALYAFFTLVWLFGAAMLWLAPRLGAWGTGAYGVVLGTDILAMHATDLVVVLVAIGSFAGAALALGTLRVERA